MKKLSLFLTLILMLFLFAACSQQKQEEKPAILEVQLQTPDHIELNKETALSCIVTYGGEKVDDADEVKFEVWKHGSEKHEMLTAKNVGDGKYAVKKTFTEPGTYSVVSHVTARNMHNMPKKDIVVGTASDQQQHHAEEHHGDEHHHADVTMMLQEKQFSVNKEARLTVHITHDGQPLTKATVRFEIWKGDGKHEFIEASEKQAGQYEAVTSFREKGTYSVRIHVETEQLHEHQVEQITVK
jgi:YtkA-like